ncbi:MAG: hypothetical protein E7141_01385 [Rikenellaceae bacterium]|nr:hypothetical protein [Rikenellaceae bacterium]
MEQYKIEYSSPLPFTEGRFFELIHKKHIDAYTLKGANNIVQNVRSTYSRLLRQLTTESNHNSLLVGKVQSGKTSNLELLTALAFDNGYNLLIIYGGYDTELLRQCTERFGATFDSASGDDIVESDTPIVFTTNTVTKGSNPIACLTADFAVDLLEEGRPIIITCLKNSRVLSKMNRLLRTLVNVPNIKPFIIDDEGDQASLNTAKKKEKGTPTYNAIKAMKGILGNPLYLSVTATPQANIFQDDISALIPASVHLIQPGVGYNGASIYHLSENEIIQSIAEEQSSTTISDPLRKAIYYFIVASAIKQLMAEKKKEKLSDMIIHVDRKVSEHGALYSCVNDELKNIKAAFENKDDDVDGYTFYLNKLKNSYTLYTSEVIQSQFPFDNTLLEELAICIKKTGVILQNGLGKETKETERTKWHKIYIGGDLLQRGLTFPNLIVSYFTRFAKSGGNMDTTLQRARWFGYRSKYLDLCKIFTTDEISKEFTVLAEVEDDLWEQFEDVEKGLLEIKDIIIQAENTKQKPTAKNKAKFKKISFRNRWVKQKFIVTNDTERSTNNEYIQNLITSVTNWTKTTNGSNIGVETAQYTIFTAEQLNGLIQSIETAFDREPFNKATIKELVGTSDIPVILMWTDDANKTRYRSIYQDAAKDRIKALHQGANTTDIEKLTYLGDQKVVVDPNKINIQIHYISPGLSKHDLLGKDQYMFAIYMPKDKIYFVKDND